MIRYEQTSITYPPTPRAHWTPIRDLHHPGEKHNIEQVSNRVHHSLVAGFFSSPLHFFRDSVFFPHFICFRFFCVPGIHIISRLCATYIEFVDSGYIRLYRSYRAYASSAGYGHGGLAELTEVPGIACKSSRTHRSSGYCMQVLQNSQKSRASTSYMHAVLVPVPAPRYFTKCRVPGIYPGIYPIFRGVTLLNGWVRVWDVVPVPRVLWHGHTKLTEVSGTGMNAIQNSQKFRVRV